MCAGCGWSGIWIISNHAINCVRWNKTRLKEDACASNEVPSTCSGTLGQSNRLFARRCAHARVATPVASRIDLSEAIMPIWLVRVDLSQKARALAAEEFARSIAKSFSACKKTIISWFETTTTEEMFDSRKKVSLSGEFAENIIQHCFKNACINSKH